VRESHKVTPHLSNTTEKTSMKKDLLTPLYLRYAYVSKEAYDKAKETY